MASPTDDPPDTRTPKELPLPLRWLLKVFAVLCLILGLVGVFVPGLPTTVFILMAAWAAARCSPALYRWLWHHRLFGPMLRNWANGGCVSRRAKWSATLMMGLSSIILSFTQAPLWAVALASICMACVLAWLWRRPEPARNSA
ncbi:YbaN family protein [Acidovorax sp. JHL-9]|uniref:YbaN family protein n=1 Tax=Acidovorax sp. JHL-9 TaxID=1276756 RepID=UPI00047A8D45|nr:YbaN family protein [Acidovorax sp. JHL-9]